MPLFVLLTIVTTTCIVLQLGSSSRLFFLFFHVHGLLSGLFSPISFLFCDHGLDWSIWLKFAMRASEEERHYCANSFVEVVFVDINNDNCPVVVITTIISYTVVLNCCVLLVRSRLLSLWGVAFHKQALNILMRWPQTTTDALAERSKAQR